MLKYRAFNKDKYAVVPELCAYLEKISQKCRLSFAEAGMKRPAMI
jgi:hypothetical protein